MSQFLFPHAAADPRRLRLRLAALGLAGFLALALVGGVLALQTLGILSKDLRVSVQLPTVGDTLGINSDVKYHGLRVGRVVDVEPTGTPGAAWAGPTATVLVSPEHAALIPAGVKARVLPGTLFGNEYVDLVTAAPPAGSAATPATATAALTTAGHLSDGDVVEPDTSAATLRLMDTFSATQRLLSAIDPAQWDIALSQLAGALEGRGAVWADLIKDGDAFLARWSAEYPQVQQDLDLLVRGTDLVAAIEPSLVAALRDTRPLARTLTRREQDSRDLMTGLSDLLDGRVEGADGITAFLLSNGEGTARLLNATAANLEVFAERHPAFAQMLRKVPVLLRNGAKAVKNGRIQMEGVLAPQLLDPYDADDCPTYRGLKGACG